MLKQLSVFLPNKPGQLANFFELMINSKIFIRSMTVAETDDYGLLLMLVDKFEKCIDILEQNKLLYSATEVIAIKSPDNIGTLYKISKILGENKVNIEYLYSTLFEGEALIVLRVNDNEKAVQILKENNYNIFED
ncbi:MAG: hypothetical protein ACTSPD_01615 [Promethearchaeota archaeon]